ncbi:hypothetical protein PCANC_09542 [Puccinia coronata f. sp. avenae]|uniref:ERCC4 domain-containing protein n=1 Tax=Puccinia coronata f. sp. avenae TaxID=200324 RepID=A0A2N5V4Y0_9BASI|nr:hypothetical protein PCANC_09542 [Puccinia coronata f. sp. avenae]
MGTSKENSDGLLGFQRAILKELHEKDGLLLLARGLGLRSIISSFLKAHCAKAVSTRPPLVFVINATTDDEAGINDKLGMRMACIHHEISGSERERIFKQGGVLSITSRILIVDMLNSKIELANITGIVVLHAEEVSPSSIEAFILRVFRKSNTKGFIKAFSEEPEHFTYGFSPLQTVLSQLKIRNVFLWPRFRVEIKEEFEAMKPQVIELHQPMSPAMTEIQTAIIESMDATLAEVRRGNTNLEVDDLTIDNALHRSFDQIIRNQLNPIWHRVSYKTKQLVSDLKTLRQLLSYLLAFDCITFYRFLETILVANSPKESASGLTQNESPWLFTSAADTIFSVSKNRVYLKKESQGTGSTMVPNLPGGPTAEEEEAMREIEEIPSNAVERGAGHDTSASSHSVDTWDWLPKGIEPVLENQPKWKLIKDVLQEIEENLYQTAESETGSSSTESNTILIMCSSTSTCSVLKEYLATQHVPSDSKYGTRPMMKRRLRDYFFWKGTVGKMSRNQQQQPPGSTSKSTADDHASLSAALKRKTEYQRKATYLNKRRRVRGASNAVASGNSRDNPVDLSKPSDPVTVEKEAIEVADLFDSMTSSTTLQNDAVTTEGAADSLLTDEFDGSDFVAYFDMLSMDDLVVIQVYLGDEDDTVLDQLRPRHVIMYEPDVAFVRRVECYRLKHPELNVKPYFLMYSESVEEQRYLSSIRREKESFEKLIRENSTMVIPLEVEARPGDLSQEVLVHAISSRQAGGKSLKVGMPKVVVDVREFRSSLPSLLHAKNFTIEPTTLLVGDYILSPEMCVERKSIADLIQSFNSGRLYQQCEMMSAHYKTPILLIEFDEKKSFTLETYKETRGNKTSTIAAASSDSDLQAKLVLLTLTFKKLRLIWSSSPSATAEIFRDLKLTHPEPDAERASLVGMDEISMGEKGRQDLISIANNHGNQSFGILSSAHDLLKALPGMDELKARKLIYGVVNSTNPTTTTSSSSTNNNSAPVSTVPSASTSFQVNNFKDLCHLSQRDLKNLFGPESGSRLFRFIHDEVDRL